MRSIALLYILYRDCRRMHILNCRSSIYTLLHSRIVKNFMRADKLSTEPLWISEPVRYSDSFSRLWARAFSLTHLGVCWKWNIFHAVLVHYASSLYGKPSWYSCYLHRMRWAFWSSVWFREECDGFKSVSFSGSSWRESLGCRSDHCAPPLSYIAPCKSNWPCVYKWPPRLAVTSNNVYHQISSRRRRRWTMLWVRIRDEKTLH